MEDLKNEVLRLTNRILALEALVEKNRSDASANIAGQNSLYGKLLKDLEESNKRIYEVEKGYADFITENTFLNNKVKKIELPSAQKLVEKPKSFWDRFK